MTTTPAMPELPEPDYWSTRDDGTPLFTAYQMRAYALATLQAQPAEVSDEEIDALMPEPDGSAEHNRVKVDLGGGITGTEYDEVDAWSAPLVRQTVRAILALRPQAESEARRAAQEQLYTERERHTAEVKRLQAEIGRLQSLRPQAVPMTELPDFDELPDDAIDNACAAGGIYRVDLMRAWESLRTDGITAPAGGEKQA